MLCHRSRILLMATPRTAPATAHAALPRKPHRAAEAARRGIKEANEGATGFELGACGGATPLGTGTGWFRAPPSRTRASSSSIRLLQMGSPEAEGCPGVCGGKAADSSASCCCLTEVVEGGGRWAQGSSTAAGDRDCAPVALLATELEWDGGGWQELSRPHCCSSSLAPCISQPSNGRLCPSDRCAPCCGCWKPTTGICWTAVGPPSLPSVAFKAPHSEARNRSSSPRCTSPLTSLYMAISCPTSCAKEGSSNNGGSWPPEKAPCWLELLAGIKEGLWWSQGDGMAPLLATRTPTTAAAVMTRGRISQAHSSAERPLLGEGRAA
mmetsp:Transcript_28488/g.80389  ORF Transcript_28488/g.80389 Transcript_28488/m.80389 type:complete len:324 (-) Transcript_28488:114-1085(-)